MGEILKVRSEESEERMRGKETQKPEIKPSHHHPPSTSFFAASATTA